MILGVDCNARDLIILQFLIFIQYRLNSGPLTQYKNLVKEGQLQFDPYQEKVALELDNLLQRLQQYEKEMQEYHVIRNPKAISLFHLSIYNSCNDLFHTISRSNYPTGKKTVRMKGASFY